MTQFLIGVMPSRKLNSNDIVYYVRDAKTQKLITRFDSNIKKVEDIEGWTGFSTEQRLELQNYVANIRFTMDRLQLSARLNRTYRILLPQPMQELLNELYAETQKHNIYFDPITAMLNGLLNHISGTQKRLQAVGGEAMYDKFDISANSIQKDAEAKENRKYSKKIFKQLLLAAKGLEKYAKIAQTVYHKDTNLNSATLAKYAEGGSKPSQWSISCALMVLAKAEDEIIATLPIEILVSLWLKPLQFAGGLNTVKSAVRLFQETFKLSPEREKKGIQCITSKMEQAS